MLYFLFQILFFTTVLITAEDEIELDSKSDVLEQLIVDDKGLELFRENRQAIDELRDHTHINKIDVKCSDTGFEVSIEFEATFTGLIYSKGYYDDPKCR